MSEQPLPTLQPPEGPDGGSGAQPPVQVDVSSARLVGTLAVAGALAGLAIVLVFQWANPRIEKHRAEVLAQAITEVLAGPDHYETVFLDDGRLTPRPEGDTVDLDRIYVGYDADGNRKGVAVVGAEAGFQDVITLIFGYDPSDHNVIGMKVLESKETPGLGDKITKDTLFVGEFDDVATPLVGVKRGAGKGLDSEVEMITGATISSRAVIRIINHRVEALKAPIDTYWSSPASESGDGSSHRKGTAAASTRGGGR